MSRKQASGQSFQPLRLEISEQQVAAEQAKANLKTRVRGEVAKPGAAGRGRPAGPRLAVDPHDGQPLPGSAAEALTAAELEAFAREVALVVEESRFRVVADRLLYDVERRETAKRRRPPPRLRLAE